MANLTQLVRVWIKAHPSLKGHYRVTDFNATCQRGSIRFSCDNDDGAGLVSIYDDRLTWYMNEALAADPALFSKLEEALVKYHDRASVSNLIMFKSSCETKLHKCLNPKTFCGC